MNFKGDFLLLGKTDISALRERVLAFGEEDWNRDAWRRNQFKAHQQTTTIPLIFDEDFRHAQPTARPDYAPLREAIEPVLGLIRDHYDRSEVFRRLPDANAGWPCVTAICSTTPQRRSAGSPNSRGCRSTVH